MKPLDRAEWKRVKYRVLRALMKGAQAPMVECPKHGTHKADKGHEVPFFKLKAQVLEEIKAEGLEPDSLMVMRRLVIVHQKLPNNGIFWECPVCNNLKSADEKKESQALKGLGQ